MSKGTSAHVMSIKQRIEKQEIAVTLDNAQVGDHQMTWIDSFCSNTGQGGYETSCVIEADLKKAKELYPDLKEICHCSDAGSGYKSTQCVLFARNSKKLTGIQIKHWHYNASGEGKRWETDGHNTDIKSQREAAMRAGQPGKCVTPTNEVDAQIFKGGGVEIEDAYYDTHNTRTTVRYTHIKPAYIIPPLYIRHHVYQLKLNHFTHIRLV